MKTKLLWGKRYSLYLMGIALLIFLVLKSFHFGDFKVFLEAAKLVGKGESPYHQWLFVSQNVYCKYFYSPLWAVLLIPSTYLPYYLTNFFWLTANVWFLFRIWMLLSKYVQLDTLPKAQYQWVLILTLIMSARFILHNFEMIQMTIFLLWGSLESLQFVEKKNMFAGGLLLALVINIKILPVVLVPYLLYRKEYKAFASTLIFSLLFLLLPAIFLGWNKNLTFLSDWWREINPGNTEHLLETDLGFHSLTALIPTLLTKTKGPLPFARNLFNLGPSMAITILNGVRIVLIVVVIRFMKWPPFVRATSQLQVLYELSYLFLLVPLIFPHQQKYAFVFILPALFYLSYFITVTHDLSKNAGIKGRRIALMILLVFAFLLMTLTTDGLIGKRLSELTQYYKTITYGALLLIVALAISSPDYPEKSHSQ